MGRERGSVKGQAGATPCGTLRSTGLVQPRTPALPGPTDARRDQQQHHGERGRRVALRIATALGAHVMA
ncbi:hypothetical protein [Streptomyces sp. NBC_01014]|uniref:hypothetical protein n=1 Tax=Streptomyces sp. NBC_01014 TaxID=2903719 RepID=UPI00386E724F|nr:hypothetical protein OG282_05460 [Streptomyces sp. NBC_01014]